MNTFNATANFTGKGYGFPRTTPIEEPIYKQFKPVSRDLIALPKPMLYLLMAAAVIVGVAYAIVGHLIKDLALDIADCLLGPADDGEDDKNLGPAGPRHPPHTMHPNAFHVWDQDDVVVPLPSPAYDYSPGDSPLAMAVQAAIPYIHSIPSILPTRSLHHAHPQSPTNKHLLSPTKHPPHSPFKDSPGAAAAHQAGGAFKF